MQIKRVTFATTNKGKLEEARSILGMEVDGTPLEIDEIQSLDPVRVAVEKAKVYFKELQKPLFVEDTSLSFNGLNGLPGTYISDFSKMIGNEGLVKLINENRKATAQVTVVYVDEAGKEHVFEGKIDGTISNEPKGENGFGWDQIFIPDGEERTFGEMSLEEKNKYSMRAIALRSFSNWLSSQK